MDAAEAQYLYLTTKGRRSGLPREIEIWFTCHQGRYYVIAEYCTSYWVQNLQADARVQVRVGEKSFDATARVIVAEGEPELQSAVRQLSQKKYGWGEGLIVELAPDRP